MKRITLRLADDTYAQLEQDARMLGIAPAVLVRAYVKSISERRMDFIRIVETIDGMQLTDMQFDSRELAAE